MIYFFDTSALSKKYVAENESHAILKLIDDGGSIYASPLTKLELCSTLEIAKNTRRLNSPEYHQAFRTLEKDFRDIKDIEINENVLFEAFRLIRLYKLRAPDAIHLASALELRNVTKENVTLVCYDKHLIDAARLERLKIFNPQ